MVKSSGVNPSEGMITGRVWQGENPTRLETLRCYGGDIRSILGSYFWWLKLDMQWTVGSTG